MLDGKFFEFSFEVVCKYVGNKHIAKVNLKTSGWWRGKCKAHDVAVVCCRYGLVFHLAFTIEVFIWRVMIDPLEMPRESKLLLLECVLCIICTNIAIT